MTYVDGLRSMVAIAEVPGEPGILDELVASSRRLLDARFGIALLVGPDGTPTALSHQGMTSAQVGAMPHLPGPVGLVGVVLAGEVLRLAAMADHPASVGFPIGHVAMGPLLAGPITVDGIVLGALYLTRSPGEPVFTADDEESMQALTRMTGLVVAVRRRMSGHRPALDGLVTLRLGLSEPTAPGAIGSVGDLVATARTVLGVDSAFLSRLHDGQQTVVHVSSRAGAPAVAEGLCVPDEEGYCAAMLRGELPSAVPDTARHPVAAGLPLTADLGVGSYNGVPVVLADGSTYGTLCTIDRLATTDAEAARRSESLRVLAQVVGLRLDQHTAQDRRHDEDRAVLEPLVDGTRRTTVLQPIVDLASGVPVGYEALSRFTDVHGGPLRPDLVFSEASRLGVGVRLEQAALASALQLLPRIPEHCYLSVNLSPLALAAPTTHDLLTSADAHRILLEITEHDAVLDYPALARLTEHLRARGVRVAVDDAGSGYASLQHVTQLQPDVIKLDIAFVRDVDSDRNRRAIARALIAYATETGASLVAEGIETDAELATLHALGAPLGQGYLLGRPGPADALLPGTQLPDARLPRPPAPRARTTRTLGSTVPAMR